MAKATTKETDTKKPAEAEFSEDDVGQAQATTSSEVSTEVKQTSVAIVSAELSDEDILADAGAGSENIHAKDLATPFFGILQALSPQCTPTKPEYNKDARPGEIFNNVTGQRYPGDTGILFIPAIYMRRFTEWRPRNTGGGLVKDWGLDDSPMKTAKQNEKKAWINSAGNIIVESGTFYGMHVKPDFTTEFGIISMASTQLKKARRWNYMIQGLQIPNPKNPALKFNPAMFFQSYRLKTVGESNNEGSWFGWTITAEKPTLELPGGKELYLACKKFGKDVADGLIEANPSAIQQEGDSPF